MSKKHRGRFKGDPVTYQLPNPAGGVQLETFVPWTLVKRGLKKQVITPLDAPQEFLSEATREREARSAAQDTALMRALGLAHHWQRLLDEQRAASVAEIAEAEGMDVTQVRRVMRLTLLAPEVVERLVGSPDAVLEKVMRRPWPNCCRRLLLRDPGLHHSPKAIRLPPSPMSNPASITRIKNRPSNSSSRAANPPVQNSVCPQLSCRAAPSLRRARTSRRASSPWISRYTSRPICWPNS